MKCSSCHRDCLPNQQFCPDCGTALQPRCRSCGSPLQATDKFCSSCGASQKGPKADLSSETDRRPITALFCDLVGSTKLSTMLDPEDLRDIIRSYQERAAQVISHYGGYISRFMGDGILVFFGYPVAQENAAELSVRAGLDLVKEVGKLKVSDNQPLKVRIGIATGIVVAGDLIGEGSAEERAVVGETPNLAARLQSLAEPDQVIVANSTCRIVRGLFSVTDLGKQDLKGFSELQHCWRVDGARQEDNRFEMTHAERLTELVGRESELQLLLKLLDTSIQGQGQVVQISGDGGIGKSRIIQELRLQVPTENFNVAAFHCSPIHQNTALYPIIQFLNRLLDRPGRADNKLTTLESILERLTLNNPESVQLLGSLLAIDLPPDRYPTMELSPQKKRALTHEVLSQCVTSLSNIGPGLFIWEDLHWADPSTLEVLELVLANVGQNRQMQLFSFRPEFNPPWQKREYITDMVLQQLDESQTSRLIRALFKKEHLPAGIVDSLVERSDGVPLFAEELAQMAIESSQIKDKPLAKKDIPFSLHDSLVSRLDRLGPGRRIAQVSAALGRQFTPAVLCRVIDESESDIDEILGRLVQTQILTRLGAEADSPYRFRHALIQDAAYGSMLNRERRQVHLQIADRFESDFAEIVALEPEVLAYHLTEAGEAVRAIRYWKQAGDKAQFRFDNVEAVNHYKHGVALLESLSSSSERTQTELALLLAMGVPLSAIRGFASEEVGSVYGRAKDICLAIGTAANLHLILNGLYRFYFVRGDVNAAQDVADRLMTLAEACEDSGQRIYANQAISFTLSMQGETVKARAHLENVERYYDQNEHLKLIELYGADALLAARTNGAVAVLFLQGEFQLAYDWINQALAIARQRGNPFELGWALSYAGVAAAQFGNVDDVLRHTGEGIAISTRYEMPNWLASCRILRGWGHWRGGSTELGLTEMREGILGWLGIGAGIFLPFWQSLLLSALVEEGLVDEGFEVYNRATAHIQKSGELWWTTEIERLHGELLAFNTSDHSHTAIETIQRSIATATKRKQPALVLRGRISLARHEPSESNLAKLTECLEEFSPEFETADLIQARKLVRLVPG